MNNAVLVAQLLGYLLALISKSIDVWRKINKAR